MKKMKKTLACLLAALLIFSTVPMSALADEAPIPVAVETTAEEVAQDTEPDAEPTPEITAEPTATPEASTEPSAEPTTEPTPAVAEEPTEPETSAEPDATTEPTVSPTPNPNDGISLLALGDEAVTRYRTVGVIGEFYSNLIGGVGEYPLYDILLNGTSYPAYCLQHGKGRINNGAYVQRDNYGMTEAMRRIVAYGFNDTNSFAAGATGWYSAETAKAMVTQHLIWIAAAGYITVDDNNNWSWDSRIDGDVDRLANSAYNGSVVRSYYAELKDQLLRSEIVPSFAGKSSDGSDAQEIDLQLVDGKYTATVTDTNGVLDLFDFQQAGFDVFRNGNSLTISTSKLPEQEITVIGAGYTTGDKNSIAVWEDKYAQENIQHQATCPGTTQTMAYIKIKGERPTYTVTLTKTSADVKITNGNANYSLEGAVYNVYKASANSNHDYTNDPVIASFKTSENGHATLSKKLEDGYYVTIEQVAPLGYSLDKTVHRFTVNGKSVDVSVVDDPGYVQITIKKKDSDSNTSVAAGDAKLEGAVYRVAYLENGVTVTKDITVNSSAVARLSNLPIGKLEVWEVSAPVGYKLDPTVHVYDIKANQVTSDVYELEPEDFTEEVIKGRVQLYKQYETLDDLAEEQGAEFDIYLKSAGSYDDAKDTERDHITTGVDGMATTKLLPYGTYVVHQSKGGNGRQLVEDFDVTVAEDGKVYSYDLVNVQKNAQLKIVKTSEDGVVEGIKFLVTRLEDGYSAEYTTNAAGEILTEILPIYADKDGATKYQYRVEELDTEETFGYQLPDPQIVELSEGEIASVSFYNKLIRIHTSASIDGKKEIVAGKIMLPDTITYEGLEPGETYDAYGYLVNPITEEDFLIDGKKIISTIPFVPSTPDGTTTVWFEFDASSLTEETEIVVFEKLYRNGIEIAAHTDINDKDQTVKILPLHGSITTTKVNADDPTDKISGATFGVYSDANGDGIFNVETDKLIGTLQEGDTGVYTLDSVPYGKFFLHEDEAPEGFVQDNIYYPFSITEDGQIVNFETVPGKNFPNKPIKGFISTTKVNADDPTDKISGATFGVYSDANGDGIFNAETDKLIGTLLEGDTGVYTLDSVPYGKFFLHEDKAPTGFVQDNIYYPFEITEDGQIVNFETIPGKDFPNKPIKGTVTTTKVDATNPQHKLSGAVFEIYRDADGDGRYTEGIDTLVDRMEEKKTGFYSLSDLVYGKYLIYEAQAPANFVRDTIYYPFEITEDGQTVTFETIPGKDFPNSPVPNRPKTGSTRSVLPYIAFVGSALGLATVLLVRRKKSK